MKKILTFIILALLATTMLVSCKDGKCDECGKDAVEMTEADIELFKGSDLVDKEWCTNCLAEKAVELAADAIKNMDMGELQEQLGDIDMSAIEDMFG